MKKRKLHDLIPPWVDGEKHVDRLYTGLLLSTILSCMGFALFLVIFRGWFYDSTVVPFYYTLMFPLLGVSVFFGFVLVAMASVILGISYYRGFSQGSESLYLMRRLPDRWELARRCLALPLITIGVCALAILVLTFVFLGIYLLLAPGNVSAIEQLQGVASHIYLLFIPAIFVF